MATVSSSYIGVQICCPSRATLLSGRFQHNNRVDGVNPEPCSLYDLPSCGCMRQNTSLVDNPEFWHSSFVPALHELGYTTGLFGKVLNDMVSYGCDNISGLPPGVDRQFMMCTHTFFVSTVCEYAHSMFCIACVRLPRCMATCLMKWYTERRTTFVRYRTAHGRMTTLLSTRAMPHRTIQHQLWATRRLNGSRLCYRKDRRIHHFLHGSVRSTHNTRAATSYAMLVIRPSEYALGAGPHAPHLPSTPAPWYADHPIGLNEAPRDTPYYNYSANGEQPQG